MQPSLSLQNGYAAQSLHPQEHGALCCLEAQTEPSVTALRCDHWQPMPAIAAWRFLAPCWLSRGGTRDLPWILGVIAVMMFQTSKWLESRNLFFDLEEMSRTHAQSLTNSRRSLSNQTHERSSHMLPCMRLDFRTTIVFYIVVDVCDTEQ